MRFDGTARVQSNRSKRDYNLSGHGTTEIRVSKNDWEEIEESVMYFKDRKYFASLSGLQSLVSLVMDAEIVESDD